MFDSVSSLIPDSLDQLFSTQTLRSALGAAGQGIQNAGAKQEAQLNRGLLLERRLTTGTNLSLPNSNSYDEARKNAPGKTQAAATESPDEVEARWMARLAKFAGISQSTGVKLGGL